MYRLSDAYSIINLSPTHEMWGGKMACAQTDAQRTMLTNALNDSLGCFSFTLITSGTLELESNETALEFSAGDMFTYYPGSFVNIQRVSDDYHGTCLIVDQQFTPGSETGRDLIRASLIPLTRFGRPKISLTPAHAHRIGSLMTLMQHYMAEPSSVQGNILESLYSVFIADLSITQNLDTKPLVSSRSQEIFISFYALMLQHFVEQRGIAFYADALHITDTYLSRVVKHITGHTVLQNLDQLLAAEATWLLRSTTLTVSQIADQLHFASTSSFDKFYLRTRGMRPLAARKM